MKATNKKFSSFARLRNGAAILAAVALLAVASSSHAALITVNVNAGRSLTIDSLDVGTVEPMGGDLYRWFGSATYGLDVLGVEWDLEIDPDPFVGGAIGVTNLTNATQTVDVTVTELVGFNIAAGASMNGSSLISILDLDGNTTVSMAAPANSSIYSALIDGNTETTLFADVYALTDADALPFDSQSFSGNTSQAVTASIGVRHHFEISAGDQATANSRFEVVPEPTAAALAFLGGFGLLLARRRNG